MKQKLYSYKFVEGKGVTEQLEEFNKSIDDLENIDVKIEDEDKALMLLNALPKSYEHLKDAMLFGRQNSITFEEVQSALKAKEFQKNSAKSVDLTAESLSVSANDKQQLKKKGPKKQKQKQGKKEVGKESRSCHWCKKPGHLKKDCYAFKRKQAEENKGQDTADLAEDVEATEILNVMDGRIHNSWIMDSGCSFHVTSNLDCLMDLREAEGSVSLGNDHVCYVKAIGNVKFHMDDGTAKILADVRYIPEIKRNLISLGLLERKGFSFSSVNGVMQVCKGSAVVMKAIRHNSLYYLQGKAIDSQLNLAEKISSSMWHRRLGHVGISGMRELVKAGIISSSTEILDQDITRCEQCIIGKSKKLTYQKGKHTSVSPLEYAHSDIWGPAQTQSIGGGRYFLTIIDDFSRKIWLFVMKEKSEAFTKFRDWCKAVETEKGKSLKCLRTDNGLEFLSSQFDDFCKERGIKRHRTVPNNPQQNGVAERANRTLLERVRCMLFDSGMPKSFWGEAAATAAFLINKCPSSSIDFSTPDSKWYGSVGDYSRLRIFGCRAFAHTRQGKLEPRAIKCVMLGYQKDVKGYRLWCTEPGNSKIVISRDVIFREEEMPFLTKKIASTQVEVEPATQEIESDGPAHENFDMQEGTHTEKAQPEIVQPQNEQKGVAKRAMPKRQIKLPAKYKDYDMMYYALSIAEQIEYHEPSTYKEAVRSPEKDKWLRAMQEEIDSLYKNRTWVLVLRPLNQKTIGCKWVYKKKVEAFQNDNIRFKARLVAKGYNQIEGIDYNEVFSPVVKHSSIRILLAIVVQRDWELHQLDVKTAFLHGDLEETIFMEQPEGFIKKGEEGKVCQLKKSLYGLKQSSRQWYLKFDQYMLGIGFKKSSYDDCVYIKKDGDTIKAYLVTSRILEP